MKPTEEQKPIVSRYTLIKGNYWIHYPDRPKQGPEPDGDTVSFLPDQRGLVESLRRYGVRAPDFNGRGVVAIRFEAIDALETHFSGAHQELRLANLARDEMLKALGFRNIEFFPPPVENKIKAVAGNPLPGYVLANGIEGNGRVLALVYPGAPKEGEVDGTQVYVSKKRFDESLNAMLLREGLAYAELYTSMPIELAGHARSLARAAREADRGIYKKEDVTKNKAAVVSNLDDAQKRVLWPKLFRRLISYFQDGNDGLGNFDRWMRADPRDRDDRVLVPVANGVELGNLHDLYDVAELAANRLKLTQHPEDLVILPDEAWPREAPRSTAADAIA